MIGKRERRNEGGEREDGLDDHRRESSILGREMMSVLDRSIQRPPSFVSILRGADGSQDVSVERTREEVDTKRREERWERWEGEEGGKEEFR